MTNHPTIKWTLHLDLPRGVQENSDKVYVETISLFGAVFEGFNAMDGTEYISVRITKFGEKKEWAIIRNPNLAKPD